VEDGQGALPALPVPIAPVFRGTAGQKKVP
jgi:hypothetical protein